jgi:hypothetical protein
MCGVPASALRDTESHSIKPVADEFLSLDAGSLADENQERCLECIFDIVLIRQGPPADTYHHGAITIQQHPERRFVVMSNKPAEQLAVGLCKHNLAAHHMTEVLENLA